MVIFKNNICFPKRSAHFKIMRNIEGNIPKRHSNGCFQKKWHKFATVTVPNLEIMLIDIQYL